MNIAWIRHNLNFYLLLSFIIQSSYVMKVPSMGRRGALFPWSSRVAPQPPRSARIAEATQKRKNIVKYCRSVRNRAQATISLPRTHEHARTIASHKKQGQLFSTWVGVMSIFSLAVYSKQGVLSHNARRNSIPTCALYWTACWASCQKTESGYEEGCVERFTL